MGRGFRSEESTDEGFDLGNVTVEAKSSKAIKVRMPDNDEDWIPFSQIHASSEVNADSKANDEGKLVISNWLAGKKGLIE